VVYAVYLKTGAWHDTVLTRIEAEQIQSRFPGAFIKEYPRIEDVPRHCPPDWND
jgi:hypothetical protein